jgi:hypothetical protein
MGNARDSGHSAPAIELAPARRQACRAGAAGLAVGAPARTDTVISGGKCCEGEAGGGSVTRVAAPAQVARSDLFAIGINVLDFHPAAGAPSRPLPRRL